MSCVKSPCAEETISLPSALIIWLVPNWGSPNRQEDYFQIFGTFVCTNLFATLYFLCVTSKAPCVTFVVVLMGDGSLLVSQPASLPCWISGVDCFVVRGGLIQATSFRYNKSNRLCSSFPFLSFSLWQLSYCSSFPFSLAFLIRVPALEKSLESLLVG